MRRFILAIVAVGALNIAINPTGAATTAHSGGRLSAQGQFAAGKHAISDSRKNSRFRVFKEGRAPIGGWGFYDNAYYYADPLFFSQCYRRTRIETLYGVHWDSVRVCR